MATRARILADYVSSGVTAAEFDFLDTTSGTPGAGNFLRGDKTWDVPSGGKVLQLKHLPVTTGSVTTTNLVADSVPIPNLVLAITPSATTSKIYIIATCHLRVFATNDTWGTARLELDRTISGGVAGKVWENAGTGTVYPVGSLPYGSDNLKLATSFTILHLDAPSTLLETTYQVNINSSQGNTVASIAAEGFSEITLMEIDYA